MARAGDPMLEAVGAAATDAPATRRRRALLLPALVCSAIVAAPHLDPRVSLPFSALDSGSVQYALPMTAVEGIDYVAKVRHGVYRGSKPDAEGIDWLRRLGVRTVINLRGGNHGEDELVRAAGMRYEWIPLKKTHAPDRSQIERFFSIVSDPSAYPIYVHCLYGVDRTGTMMALYRIREQGWNPMDALNEMAHFGDHGFKDMRRFIQNYRA